MEEPIKKRRGRRRKNEIIADNLIKLDKKVKFKENENETIVNEDGEHTQSISFGNINIVVKKTKPDDFTIDLKNTSNSVIQCLLNTTIQEIDEYNNKNQYILNTENNKLININNSKKINILKHYEDNSSNGTEITETDILCYHCAHPFKNKPCFIPYDYSPKLDRYKLFGNFCSPNCAKTYAMNSKNFSNNVFLIGQFYRKLYSNWSLKIKPAPSIMALKVFGGNLTIEQFRENFDNNVNYSLEKINAKIKSIELVIN